MKITGNTILVTGGTSGIGRALAEAFHDRGNRVIIAVRRWIFHDEIAARRPGMVGIPLDLDDATLLSRLASDVRAHFPELNVRIAIAGNLRREDMTTNGWDAFTAGDCRDEHLGRSRVALLEIAAISWAFARSSLSAE